jgi:hypothetical protein
MVREGLERSMWRNQVWNADEYIIIIIIIILYSVHVKWVYNKIFDKERNAMNLCINPCTLYMYIIQYTIVYLLILMQWQTFAEDYLLIVHVNNQK